MLQTKQNCKANRRATIILINFFSVLNPGMLKRVRKFYELLENSRINRDRS